MSTLTSWRVRELLRYNRRTGIFRWRVARGGSVKAGDLAGSPDTDGYIRITVDGKKRRACRLAWLYVYGEEPRGVIDHKNTVKTDDRIRNLRDVTVRVNNQNRRVAQRNNSTGFLGVCRSGKKFKALVWVKGKQRHLGTFDTPEGAHQEYLRVKRLHQPGCTL